jgi:hypothetical protein
VKTSRDNTEIECLVCHAMFPKWLIQQHKREAHFTPREYKQYSTQLGCVPAHLRRTIFKEKLIPVMVDRRRNHTASVSIMNADGSKKFIGSVIDWHSWYDHTKYPLDGDVQAALAILECNDIKKLETGNYMWVPAWVEQAVKSYRDNAGFAGLSLTDYLYRISGGSPLSGQ